MSQFDAHKNFPYSTVATPPSPAATGLSLVVAAGDGAKFPAVPFNAVVWPASAQPLASNAEVVRVTGVATDTLTIVRTQEGSSARTVVTGDQIGANITAKLLTDIENGLQPNPQNMLAGETFLVVANKQVSLPAGIVSAEPTGTICTIDGVGVS